MAMDDPDDYPNSEELKVLQDSQTKIIRNQGNNLLASRKQYIRAVGNLNNETSALSGPPSRSSIGEKTPHPHYHRMPANPVWTFHLGYAVSEVEQSTPSGGSVVSKTPTHLVASKKL